MIGLAKYAENMPNVGNILEYKDKYWEIREIVIKSEKAGEFRTTAYVVEVDAEGVECEDDGLFDLVLDEIDYIEC